MTNRQLIPAKPTASPLFTSVHSGLLPLHRRTLSSDAATQNAAEVPATMQVVPRSPGQAHNAASRALLESRFGHDFSRVPVQTKLALSSPEDTFEKEAEQVAGEVETLSNTFGSQVLQPSLLSVSRVMGLTGVSARSMPSTVDSLRKLSISARRDESVPESGTVPPGIESRILQSQGRGQAVPSHVQNMMALRTGRDFSNVRVKTDSEAAEMSRSINARAFTLGSDIWMGRGESPNNVRLMAHELTHVVQQGAARSMETVSPAGSENLGEKSGVMEYLQALRLGTSHDASLYSTEIERFEAGNPPDQIAELQRSLLERPAGAEISRKSHSKVMRACGCNPSGGGSAPALSKKTVTLNVTKMHGSSGNPSGDITYANTKVYNQANIEIKTGTDVTVNETDSKTVLGNDLILDEFATGSSPTTEERALLALNQSSGAVTAYYVKGLSKGSVGENFRPGHGTGLLGVVSSGAASRTLAHELGHLLLDDGSHPRDADNFLAQTSVATGKELMTPAQITNVRSSPSVK